MIISEPRERARHPSPTDADTHGPQRKKTQCCGENKGHKHNYTATHKYISKTKTHCCGDKKGTNTVTQQHTKQIHFQNKLCKYTAIHNYVFILTVA